MGRMTGKGESKSTSSPTDNGGPALEIDPNLDTLDVSSVMGGSIAQTPPGAGTPQPTGRPVIVRKGAQTRQPGSRIAQYVVQSVLGAGGMGVVYAAQDFQLGRQVAIKVLRSDIRAKHLASRLLREAQSMAKLQHPNVVTIYEIGSSQDEIYISMELVRGSTLRAWLGTTRTADEILDVFIAAGRGLQAAHKALVIHRDFKPDNVLIDGEGRVRVTDFGLARSAGDGDSATEESGSSGSEADPPRDPENEALDLTRTGQLMGTPAYMAPEQHERIELDARCDQFSFAVALYEALAGYHPFSSGSSLTALLARVITGDLVPTPPTARKLPRRLRAALMRAMSPDRERRYPSMGELLADLDRERSRGGERRRRRTLIAASAAFLVIGAAGGAVFFLGRGEASVDCDARRGELADVWNPARRHAIERAFAASGAPGVQAAAAEVARAIDRYSGAWTDMAVSACQATRVEHEQSPEMLELRSACLADHKQLLAAAIDTLSGADADLVAHRDGVMRALADLEECGNARQLASTMREPSDAFTRQKIDTAQALLSRANVYLSASQADEARPLLDQADAAVASVEFPPIHGEIDLARGRLAGLLVDLPAARDFFTRASARAEAGRDDLLRARSLIELVYLVGFQLKDFRQGEAFLEMAEATLERAGGDRALRATLLRNGGLVAMGEGKLDLALARQRQAIDLLRSTRADASAQVIEISIDMAGTLRLLGRIDEAMENANRAMSAVSKQHPLYASAVSELASDYLARGDITEAKKRFHESLERGRAIFGPNHVIIGVTYANLGAVAITEEHFTEAVDYFEKALEVEERQIGPDHLDVTTNLMNLGFAYQGAGRPEDAERTYLRALRVRRDRLGERDPLVAEAQVSLGQLSLERKRVEEALDYLERAVATLEAASAPPDERAEAHYTLALALRAGKGSEARVRDLAVKAEKEYTEAKMPAEAAAVRQLIP